MDKQEKAWCFEKLGVLPYVKWDRFFYVQDDPEVIRVFGWIERNDQYKDFVVVELMPGKHRVFFDATSSAKYSEDIAYRLGSDHNRCHKIDELRDDEK
jgi:hypothetical protein